MTTTSTSIMINLMKEAAEMVEKNGMGNKLKRAILNQITLLQSNSEIHKQVAVVNFTEMLADNTPDEDGVDNWSELTHSVEELISMTEGWWSWQSRSQEALQIIDELHTLEMNKLIEQHRIERNAVLRLALTGTKAPHRECGEELLNSTADLPFLRADDLREQLTNLALLIFRDGV